MSKSNGKGVKGQKERAVLHTSNNIDFRCRFLVALILLDATGPWLYSNILAGIGGQKVQRGHISAYFSCLCGFLCRISYPLSTTRSWRGSSTNLLGTALFFPNSSGGVEACLSHGQGCVNLTLISIYELLGKAVFLLCGVLTIIQN